MNKSQQKPWLNEDGSAKSDAELQEAIQQWPPSVWEEYLSTLKGGRREHYVLPPDRIESFSGEECVNMLFSMAIEEKYHLLKLSLNACIRGLAPRQREVIVSRFWDGKTVAEMATSMGISRQAVYKTMKAALSKIKTHLINGALQKQVIVARETASILGLARG